MKNLKLKQNNKIDEKFSPSILSCSDFTEQYSKAAGLEDYFNANGDRVTPPWDDEITETSQTKEKERKKLICDLLSIRNENKTYATIRHLTINYLSEASLIVTPITILGLMQENSKAMFEQFCSDLVGVERINQEKTYQHLSKLLTNYRKNKDNAVVKELLEDCTINMSFTRAHGLQGTFYVSDFQLGILDADIGSFLWELALTQCSIEEIMNIHSAQKLGCEYLATFSKNVKLNKNLIEEVSGIKILGSPEEVLNVLRSHEKK